MSTRSPRWFPKLALALLAVCPALAAAQTRSFHLMQVELAVGGVNGDPTAQAIQLRMRSAFQNQVQNGRLKAYDAAGNNPVVLIAFSGPVTNSNQGDRVLAATASMANYTTGFHADATMNPIPASYLAAGRLTWEDNFGGILWSLAWGGSNYTGLDTGGFTNDADGNFGPPVPGPLPTSGQGLLFTGPASAPSVSNLTDYTVTSGPATLTNNARQSFLIHIPCAVDINGDSQVNVADFLAFLQLYSAGDARADFNRDSQVNVADFLAFLAAYAAGC
jgi:hypothetical protein